MTSSLREAILAELATGPLTRVKLAERVGHRRADVADAVAILIQRGALREIDPGPIHRIELVDAKRSAPAPMLEVWRALPPADRSIMLESSAAVAESLAADLEAARAGDRRPVNVHACDVLGIATALIIVREQLASRDRELAAWETAAHLAATAPPTRDDRDAAAGLELDDERIRAERDAARFAGDHETARLCCAALGLPTGDGAHGLLDTATSRARLAARLAHRTTASATAPATEPAP